MWKAGFAAGEQPVSQVVLLHGLLDGGSLCLCSGACLARCQHPAGTATPFIAVLQAKGDSVLEVWEMQDCADRIGLQASTAHAAFASPLSHPPSATASAFALLFRPLHAAICRNPTLTPAR